MTAPEALTHAVARQVLRGLRESLTIAGQVGHPVDAVNAALHHLQAACEGCIVLTRPYAGESRVVVTVVAWDALKRAAGSMGRVRRPGIDSSLASVYVRSTPNATGSNPRRRRWSRRRRGSRASAGLVGVLLCPPQ
jgi:hypothetical protein